MWPDYTDADLARFWAKVEKTDGCWIWTASTRYHGYGQIKWGPRIEVAHRVSWELVNGPIPPKGIIAHACDNPPCVRPDHLFLTNQLGNMRDCKAKGRNAHGESHGQAKLSDAQVRWIRREVVKGPRGTQRRIAKHLGVSEALVSNIVKRKTRDFM